MMNIEWKKYFAWILFLMGTVSVGNMLINYTAGDSNVLLITVLADPTAENVMELFFTLLWLAMMALFFRTWYKWK